jgi:hypothetical protein
MKARLPDECLPPRLGSGDLGQPPSPAWLHVVHVMGAKLLKAKGLPLIAPDALVTLGEVELSQGSRLLLTIITLANLWKSGAAAAVEGHGCILLRQEYETVCITPVRDLPRQQAAEPTMQAKGYGLRSKRHIPRAEVVCSSAHAVMEHCHILMAYLAWGRPGRQEFTANNVNHACHNKRCIHPKCLSWAPQTDNLAASRAVREGRVDKLKAHMTMMRARKAG